MFYVNVNDRVFAPKTRVWDTSLDTKPTETVTYELATVIEVRRNIHHITFSAIDVRFDDGLELEFYAHDLIPENFKEYEKSYAVPQS